jgi:outer membrane biosynthesis protein TonB
MENKNPKFELESSRKVYFQLGLFIVGTVTLMAFTYKTPVYLEKKTSIEQETDVPIVYVEKQDDPIIELPKVEKIPDAGPSTPILSNNLLNNIKATDNQDVNVKNVITTDKNPITVHTFNIDPGTAPELGAVIKYPDIDAQFQGSWITYLGNNVDYPSESIFLQEEGSAFLSFVVEVDGGITDVKVLNKDLPKLLQNEAIRVVKASPKWKPGSKNGEMVRSTKVVKINFILK